MEYGDFPQHFCVGKGGCNNLCKWRGTPGTGDYWCNYHKPHQPGDAGLTTNSDRNTEFDRVNQAHKDAMDGAAMLTEDDAVRKSIPVYDGFICYFPRGMAEVAVHSKLSNDQHNPGEPMYWNRSKSMDHDNSEARHMLDKAIAGKDAPLRQQIEIQRARCWRSMAELECLLEKELEDERG